MFSWYVYINMDDGSLLEQCPFPCRFLDAIASLEWGYESK